MKVATLDLIDCLEIRLKPVNSALSGILSSFD